MQGILIASWKIIIFIP